MANNRSGESDSIVERICAFVQAQGTATPSAISEAVNWSKSAIGRRIVLMLQDGDLIQVSKAGYRKQAVYAVNPTSHRPQHERAPSREKRRLKTIADCKQGWQGQHVHKVFGSGGAYQLRGVM